MKVEVDVLDSPSLTVLMTTVDVKQHLNKKNVCLCVASNDSNSLGEWWGILSRVWDLYYSRFKTNLVFTFFNTPSIFTPLLILIKFLHLHREVHRVERDERFPAQCFLHMSKRQTSLYIVQG